MTEIKVLCVWDGWMVHTGTKLTWKVLDTGALEIRDGRTVVATHSFKCWQVVLENT